MTIDISIYTDPGVYIGEVVAPGSVAITSERTLAVVGLAPRTRRSVDEAVIRGKIYNEALSVWPAATPFVHVLLNTCDRDRNNASLYMNNHPLGVEDWSFVPAYLKGNATVAGTVDTQTGRNFRFTVALDGKRPITVTLASGLAVPLGPPALAGSISKAINDALVASPVYGPTYATAATTPTTLIANDTLMITSPLSTSASDVKVLKSYEDVANTYNDAALIVSVGAWNPTPALGTQARSYVRVKDSIYNASATYKIDYVAIDTQVDPLANASITNPLDAIINVGSYPGANSYINGSDYEKTGNTVDWLTAFWSSATITNSAPPATYNIAGTNNKLLLSINGRNTLLITLALNAVKPAADIAEEINLALLGSTEYGPAYNWVATTSGTAVILTAPTPYENYPQEHGYATSIVFYDTSNNAFTTIFGVPAGSLPYEVRGSGQRPAFGTAYYATYDYQRPSVDYANATQVYNPDQLRNYTSPITIGNYTRNELCVAGDIGFENGAPSMYLVQINDSVSPGYPTISEIHAAIDVCKEKSIITDVVVLDTSLDTTVYLMQHVSNMSSMLEKKYRRGWFGMARGTDVGDPDTPDTFVYRSVRTLQPGASSPGRGRQLLVAPADATRTVRLDDGNEVDISVDGSYIAVAVASLFTSLPSPSSALINRFITGFVIDDFGTYLAGERRTLASNGVLVVTQDAGRFRLIDPLTTEAGGGKLPQFEEPSSSAQKDAVTTTVDRLIYNNCVGVVPNDLADFITDVKMWIITGIQANIESGAIGPYVDSAGNVRKINPKTDIEVWQSKTDRRTYYFRYWYNLRYPAKRFFGEFSVDNPFFSPGS